MYVIYYFLLYPFLLILSFFRKKTDKILIIQTAKIGDYANSTIIFDAASSTKGGKFDIVLDKINLNFADYDSRIENKFAINKYKKGIKKFILGFKLFFKNYDKIYVLMPNNLNLFLAKFAFPKHIITISHYKNSSFFYLLSKNAKVIQHTKNDLTLKTYLKMLDLELFQNELQKDTIKVKKMVQKPLFIPEKCENLLINEHKFKVGLSLSAGNKMKTIIPQTWDKIFEILSKFDVEIYIFGVADEINLLKNTNTRNIKIVSLIDKISLNELPFYISKMNLYISSDTGNYYIADTMEVPTICLMGPCFASEQRGVFNSLIITSNLPPFSAVFDTIYKTDAKKYFEITQKDEKNIYEFINNLYKSFLSCKDNFPN